MDWMKKQGAFSWDIENEKIRFGEGIRIDLHEEKSTEETVRRLYVTEDIILPSSHQTEVPVRISHQSSRDRPFVGIVENQKVSSLRHTINARSLMPAKFTELKSL